MVGSLILMMRFPEYVASINIQLSRNDCGILALIHTEVVCHATIQRNKATFVMV